MYLITTLHFEYNLQKKTVDGNSKKITEKRKTKEKAKLQIKSLDDAIAKVMNASVKVFFRLIRITKTTGTTKK